MAEDRGPQLAAVLYFFLTLTCLLVGCRVYVRLLISKNWGSDDYLLLIAQAFYIVYCSSSLSGVKYGTGQHISDLAIKDPAGITKALMFWWLCEMFYTVTTVFLRCSVAVFLLRICERKVHKYIIYGTMVVVVLFSTGYFFLALFQCNPPQYFWEQYLPEHSGSCLNLKIFPDATFAHSAISATADWVLGLLPIFFIWDLKMNHRTKISVAVVLSLGIIAGIAAIVRIPTVKVLTITSDFLFETIDVAILSTIEPGLGIIATSACVLRPLFKNFYRLTGSGNNDGPGSGNTYPSVRRQNRFQFRRNHADFEDLERLGPRVVEMGAAGSTDVSLKNCAVISSSPPPVHDRLEGIARKSSRKFFSQKENMATIRIDNVVRVERHSRRESDDLPIMKWASK